MPCSIATENDDLPYYLKRIIKEIDVGDDDELKACLCDLRSYVGTDSKRYALPLCISSMNGTDNYLYTTLTEAVPNGIIREVDSQKIMELQFKYKELKTSVVGNGESDFGASCTDSGQDNPYTSFGELLTFNKGNLKKLEQVCNMFVFNANTTKFGFYSDCDNNNAGVYPFNFAMGSNESSSALLFFDQKYEEPECGQPGPILYQWYLPTQNGKDCLANGFMFNGGNTCSSGGEDDPCAEAADISEYIEW